MCNRELHQKRSIHFTWILSQSKYEAGQTAAFQFSMLIFPGKKMTKNVNNAFYVLHSTVWKPSFNRNKMLLLYFGNPEVFPLLVMFSCFHNKICLFLNLILTLSHAGYCKLTDLWFTLEAWKSGKLSRSWLFLGNQYTVRVSRFKAGKEQGRHKMRDSFQKRTSVLQIVNCHFY